jgi:anti-sigma factor RsiW
MNCDEAIEFLPWLLNGSLEAAERDEVERHLATCERCRAALKDTRDAWTIFSQHIPREALVALAYDEVPAGVDPAVAERHLATCPECAVELELARMSRQFEGESIVPFPIKKVPKTDREYRTWRGAAMAASLTGLIAFGGWFHAAQRSGLVSELEAKNQAIQQQQATLEGEVKDIRSSMVQLTKPQINTLAPELHSDVVRGGHDEIAIPANQTATPLLYADPAVHSPERTIAILNESGAPIWQDTERLRASESPGPQFFTITLLPGFLKPGRYTIQLYTIENGKRVPRESYKIRVESPNLAGT